MRNETLVIIFLSIQSVSFSQITVVGSGAGTNQINVNASYTQSFDGLIKSGSDSFSNNITLRAWYVNSEHFDKNASVYKASTGSDHSGRVYSLGANSSSERALGYVGSASNDYFNLGFRIKNSSGNALKSFNISFVGEQWRSGGSTNDNNNQLLFFYKVFSGTGNLPKNDSTNGWTQISALRFEAPQKSTTTGALNGNASSQRKSFSTTIQANVNNGQEIWFRWLGNDGNGYDAALGVDDFSITPSSSLPVTWVFCKANLEGDHAIIRFATSSEENNQKFELQRKIQWKDEFLNRMEIPGKGTIQGISNYKIEDKINPVLPYVYRIKQTDWNGNFSYSNVFFLLPQENCEMLLFPNPCKNHLWIGTSNPMLEGSSITIVDMQGKIILNSKIKKAGVMHLPLPNEMRTGVYMAKLLKNGRILGAQKLIIR